MASGQTPKSGVDWDRVRAALEISQFSEQAAFFELMQAIGDEINIDMSTGESSLPDQVGDPEARVDYGVGYYTDESDPRQPSAKAHVGGKGEPTTAVNVLVLVNPSTPYRCVYVAYFGPHTERGGGRTLILVDQDGGHETVVMGTGASSSRGDYSQRILHTPGQDIVIAGDGVKFTPPNLGGASVFLQDAEGRIISDEVRSMGLPRGDHSVYEVRFEKR